MIGDPFRLTELLRTGTGCNLTFPCAAPLSCPQSWPLNVYPPRNIAVDYVDLIIPSSEYGNLEAPSAMGRSRWRCNEASEVIPGRLDALE